MTELDLTFVDKSVERIGKDRHCVLPLLQAIQGHYGYLPNDALEHLCAVSDCAPSDVWSVATFYDQFRLRPAGKHFVKVCIGTACHVKGANRIYEAFRQYLNITGDDDTDAERTFTVEKVACLGCCMLAPAIQIDDIIYGHLQPETVGQILNDFKAQQGRKQSDTEDKAGQAVHHGQARICLDSSCRAVGSGNVYAALKQAVKRLRLPVRVKSTGCHGMSYLAPLVEVLTADGQTFRYGRVQPADVEPLLRRHFRPTRLTARLGAKAADWFDSLIEDRIGEGPVRYNLHVRPQETDQYLDPQVHIATEHFGHTEPLDIDEYKANGGFAALHRCLALNNP